MCNRLVLNGSKIPNNAPSIVRTVYNLESTETSTLVRVGALTLLVGDGKDIWHAK